MQKTKAAVIGSGNIGADLMLKITQLSKVIEMGALIGIDPSSPGLGRAARLGIPTTSSGVEGFKTMPEFSSTEIVVDATSASAHSHHDAQLRKHGKIIIHLTRRPSDRMWFLPSTVQSISMQPTRTW
jgi:acetaldehyde dehydrogenase